MDLWERERRRWSRRNLESVAAISSGGRRCLRSGRRSASAGEARTGRGRRWSNRRYGEDDGAVRTLLVREFRPTSADSDDGNWASEERRRRRRWRNEEEEAFARRCLNNVADSDSDDTASEDTELVKRYLDEVLLRRHGNRDHRLWSSRVNNKRRSRSCEQINKSSSSNNNNMLAPPVLLTTPDGGTDEVDARRNSCVSDGSPAGPFLLRAAPAGSRRASALSASGIAAVAAAAAKRQDASGGRKAFLLRQRSTGEEVVVTMAALGSPVKGARAVVSAVPTFMTHGTQGTMKSHSRKASFDDHQVSYDSLMTPADYSRRFSEMVHHSQDVLLQNHLEKIYQKFRSSRGSEEEADFSTGDQLLPGGDKVLPGVTRKRREDRLDDWLMEMERRKRRPSCALGEFGRQAAASAKGPMPMATAVSTKSLPRSAEAERLYREVQLDFTPEMEVQAVEKRTSETLLYS